MPDATHRPSPVTLVVMDVSGVGKTTIARALVERTGWVFQEGDDLHPEANQVKMAAGTPLTDDDRWPWLRRVADWIEYMPPSLLRSQLDTLEPLAADEPGVRVETHGTPDDVATRALQALGLPCGP